MSFTINNFQSKSNINREKTWTYRSIHQEDPKNEHRPQIDSPTESFSEEAISSKKSSSNISDVTRVINISALASYDVSSCDNCVETDTMRTALQSIAHEMQKFYSTGTEYNESDQDQDNLLGKLSVIRSTLVQKNSLIRRLKTNLKMACTLAQSVWSSKDSESAKLSNRLQSARSEATMLLTMNRERNSVLKQVECDTKMIRDRLDNLHSFIQQAYEQLQRIRSKPCKDIPVSMKLRQIIISCGQYYADYTNEHAKCLQLEQRNRFLTNKINVIESNRKENPPSHRHKSILCYQNKVLSQSSSSFCELPKSPDYCKGADKKSPLKSDHQLATHFKLVRNILDDQDRMLKDLKDLAVELNNESSFLG